MSPFPKFSSGKKERQALANQMVQQQNALAERDGRENQGVRVAITDASGQPVQTLGDLAGFIREVRGVGSDPDYPKITSELAQHIISHHLASSVGRKIIDQADRLNGGISQTDLNNPAVRRALEILTRAQQIQEQEEARRPKRPNLVRKMLNILIENADLIPAGSDWK